MELYFGEYQHVQQEYGVHLRLASDETRKSRNSQHAKAGSYGVSIRVQGIDGHPYIVLNNTEQCLAGTSFSENGPPFPAPMINNLPLHPSKGSVVEETSAEELQLPENPYAPPGPVRNLKQPSLFEGKNGALERKEEPRKASPMLNFERHPELLQPYDPEKNELSLKNHQPPETSWLKALREEGTNNKKAWMPKPNHSQPTSPPSEDPARSNVTAAILKRQGQGFCARAAELNCWVQAFWEEEFWSEALACSTLCASETRRSPKEKQKVADTQEQLGINSGPKAMLMKKDRELKLARSQKCAEGYNACSFSMSSVSSVVLAAATEPPGKIYEKFTHRRVLLNTTETKRLTLQSQLL